MAIFAPPKDRSEDDAASRLDHKRELHGGIAAIEDLLQQRALFASNIHLADQKSGYIAILHGVLFTGVSGIMQNNVILAKLTTSTDQWLYACTILMLLCSFAANMLAFVPRVRQPAPQAKSWLDVANASVDALVEAAVTMDHAERLRHVAFQVKALAAICNRKFEFITYAIVFLSIAVTSSIGLYLRLVLA